MGRDVPDDSGHSGQWINALMEIDSEPFYKKLKKRSREAFHILYEELKIPIYKIVYGITRDNEKTADIIQDTFIQVIKKIHQIQDIRKIKPWIFRIAVNLTLNMLNKDRRISLPGDELEAIADKITAEDFPLHQKDDPEELRFLIMDMVERLPLKQQVVFNLKYVQNFKEVEIGEMVDIPVGTVKSRLNIARSRIKQWLIEANKEAPSFDESLIKPAASVLAKDRRQGTPDRRVGLVDRRQGGSDRRHNGEDRRRSTGDRRT